MDDSVLLLTISVFIVSSHKDVICVPNLIKPCADIFKKAWQSDDIMVSRKFSQCIWRDAGHISDGLSCLHISFLCVTWPILDFKYFTLAILSTNLNFLTAASCRAFKKNAPSGK